MDIEKLIIQGKRISENSNSDYSIYSEGLEFLRVYAGEKSSFYTQLLIDLQQTTNSSKIGYVKEAIIGFISFLENGLFDGISLERRAQIDVVSDYLDQARLLLLNKKTHPAAACVLIGASLEEFLRNWMEAIEVSLDKQKPSIDNYSNILKANSLITKQDAKDILSWAGLRNHAAHGEWGEVNDKTRISLMLEGVNLFIRKYSLSQLN